MSSKFGILEVKSTLLGYQYDDVGKVSTDY